ncbi:MAG: tetratricopeptide repeat protein, partial [Chloroflexota bacterium]|nr:tetratricopeptide repeat protein [Chloroflexota bacterium]
SDPTARTLGRARALLAAVMLAFTQGDYHISEGLAPETLDLLRSLGLKRELGFMLMGYVRFAADDQLRAAAYGEARALLEEAGDARSLASLEWFVADSALERGDYAAARTGHHKALEILRAYGDEIAAAAPLISLGRLACVDGDYDRARALVEEGLALRRREVTDGHFGVAIALISLGEVNRCTGDAAAGAPLFEEALGYGRELADDAITGWALHNLGHVALASGDLRSGAMRFRDGLALRRPAHQGPDIARGYAGLASVALRAGDGLAAARLFGGTEAILRGAGVVMVPCDELVRRGDIAQARASLDPDAFSSAFAEGESVEPEQLDAISVALIADLDDAAVRGATRV